MAAAAVKIGSLMPFVRDPGAAVCARGGVATGTEAYIEPDGQWYSVAMFPALAAVLADNVSSDGLSFTTPNLKNTGRFLRSRSRDFDIGPQANQNLSHNHAIYDPGHGHGVYDPGHQHYIQTIRDAVGGNDAVGNLQPTFPYVRQTNYATSNITIYSSTADLSLSVAGGIEACPEWYSVFYGVKT